MTDAASRYDRPDGPCGANAHLGAHSLVYQLLLAVSDFVSSSRRSLRLPLRCVAVVEAPQRSVEGHSEDVGSRGCCLVLPGPLAPGSQVRVILWHDAGARVLAVEAKVVWASEGAPWRHGVAFTSAARPEAEPWFDNLLEAHTDLLHADQVPDRLRLDWRLRPAGQVDAAPLGVDEAAVYRLASSRPTVADLQSRLGPDWTRAKRALFALLTRGVLTLDDASPAGPARGPVGSWPDRRL